MSEFEKYKHMKIEGESNNLRMLVADDGKGNKNILWHGPEKLYGDTLQSNQLKIIGILDSSSSAGACEPCLTPYKSEQAGIISGSTPAVIIYDAQAVYKKGDDTHYSAKQQVYKESALVDDYWQETTSYGIPWIGFQLLGNNNKPWHYRPIVPGDEFLPGVTDHEYLINFTKSGTTYDYTANTTTGKLPDGDVVAMVKIKSGCSIYRAWHFHLGLSKGGTYQNNGGLYLRLDAQDEYNRGSETPAFVWPENCTTYDTAKTFIPEKDTWYEFYIDRNSLSSFYDYSSDKDWGNLKNWKFLRIRKASENHIKWWCSQEESQTEAEIKYSTDSIKYDFNIKKDTGEVLNTKSLTLTQLKTETTIDADNEVYSTPVNTVMSTYLYSPTVPLVLTMDKYVVEPRVFSGTNKINVVYYSNCEFSEIPEKVYGKIIMNETSGLSITGLVTPYIADSNAGSAAAICCQAISDNNQRYAVITKDSPAIITYEPKHCYTIQGKSAKDSEVIAYYEYEKNGVSELDNLYEVSDTYWLQGSKSYANDGNTWSGNKNWFYYSCGVQAGFVLTGDDVNITKKNKLRSRSCLDLTFDKDLVTFDTSGNATFNTKGNALPSCDGLDNIIALIYISSKTDERFKKKAILNNSGVEIVNSGWHFHLGQTMVFILNTYGHGVFSKYNVNWGSDAWKQEASTGQYFVYCDGYSVGDFVPEDDTWYTLYIDLGETTLKSRKQLGGSSQSLTNSQINILKIKKATDLQKQTFLTNSSEVSQTNGDVVVRNNKINCDFSVKLQDVTTDPSITLTLPDANALSTDIKVFDEYYDTEETASSSQKTKNYCYTPSENYILSIDSDSKNPKVFNSENPINKVYYSGCTFIKETQNFEMPDYLAQSGGLNIIGLCNSFTPNTIEDSEVGQGGVPDNNVPYAQYVSGPPVINFAPKAKYKWDRTTDLSVAQSAESYYSYTESGTTKYVYFNKAEDNKIKVNALCYLLAGPNAQPVNFPGYHYYTSDNFPATNFGLRLSDLTGPDQGRFIAYFKCDSAAAKILLNSNIQASENDIVTSESKYIVHWHYGHSDAHGLHNAAFINLPNSLDTSGTPVGDYRFKLYTYTKSGSTYKYTLKSSGSNNYIEYDKWYGMIFDPAKARDKWLGTGTTPDVPSDQDANVYVCELYDSDGIIKEEHREYVSNSMLQRSCNKYHGNYIFTIHLDNEVKTCELTPVEFEKSCTINNNKVTITDKTQLPTKAFINTGTYIIPGDDTNKLFGSDNPICIPEMSGISFITYNT